MTGEFTPTRVTIITETEGKRFVLVVPRAESVGMGVEYYEPEVAEPYSQAAPPEVSDLVLNIHHPLKDDEGRVYFQTMTVDEPDHNMDNTLFVALDNVRTDALVTQAHQISLSRELGHELRKLGYEIVRKEHADG